MSDIERFEKGCEVALPEGSGFAFVIFGNLGMLSLVIAAAILGKPLWIVVALWVIGGPALSILLAVLALAWRSGGERSDRTTLMEANNNA